MRCKDAGSRRTSSTAATEDAAARRSRPPSATQPLFRQGLLGESGDDVDAFELTRVEQPAGERVELPAMAFEQRQRLGVRARDEPLHLALDQPHRLVAEAAR